MKPTIKEQYLSLLLELGHRPASVFKFMKSLGREEEEFYKEYSSFDALEREVFQGFFDEVAAELKADETYQSYDARQKMAAVYFTWFEKLKLNRSLVTVMDKHNMGGLWGPAYAEGAEESFKQLAMEILGEGMEDGQVADRWFVNQVYPSVFWNQAKFLLNAWIYDKSQDFSQTDASIEKVIRFSFDLIEPNLIDSGWDLLQFVFKRK